MKREEDGTVLLLTIFLGLVLATFVVVVVDASAAFLAHRGLASQADGAALTAAQQVDLDAFYAGDGDLLPLADATEAVAAYAEHYPGTAVAAVETDGTTVTVVLERRLRLPLAPPGFPREVTVTATATARLPRVPAARPAAEVSVPAGRAASRQFTLRQVGPNVLAWLSVQKPVTVTHTVFFLVFTRPVAET